MPPHLPNEIWMHIITHCENNRHLWLSLRQTNRQLKACVEQFFAVEISPRLQIALPMTIPTYDLRNPIKEEALFRYFTQQGRIQGTQDRVVFELEDSKPEFYLAHFFGRWAGMRDVDGGWLRPSVLWNLRLYDGEANTKIKEACAVKEGVGEEEARIEFEWKPTLTAFFCELG